MDPPAKDQSRESIHAYVREDLRRAKAVTFHTWTEAVLGVTSEKLLARAREVARLKWFEDEIVQEALVDYARAKCESDRCDPFVHLSNRIIELARGALPGVGKTYPVDNFCLANSATKVVDPIAEHGALAAKRKPDIVGLTTPNARKLYKPGGTVGWPDILTWGELKFWLSLIPVLDKERTSRGLSPLDRAGIPKDRPKSRLPLVREGLFANKPKTTARRSKAKATSVAHKPEETKAGGPKSQVKIGRKRLAEEDLLANLDKASSAKRRNSAGTSAETYDNAMAAIQSTSYALEILSGTYGTRVHCFGFVLKDDRIFLWYYDASGVVYTQETISMIADFECFAALIVAFACCTTEQFGVMPLSVLKAPRSTASRLPVSLEKRTFTMAHPRSNKDVLVTLDKTIFTQYSLMGRRTFLYTIQTKPGVTFKSLIAKFSYQVCTRKAEQDLVAVARRAGVKHLPRIHMWAELWKLSDGVRNIFFKKSNGAAAYEDRTLRTIVYTRYASIKELFSHSPKLIPTMVIQMINCLHDLRYNANMLHRDISVNNIMYEMRNGRYHFILIDFDMAVILPTAAEGSLAASSSHRTGTLPFMACELIFDAAESHEPGWKPIQHLLRHDYESLFWVALWCVLTLLLKGVSTKRRAKLVKTVRRLEEGDLESIAGRKYNISTRPLHRSKIVLPPAARPLHNWFMAWGDFLLKVASGLRGFEFRSGRIPAYDEDSEDEDDEDGEDDENIEGDGEDRGADVAEVEDHPTCPDFDLETAGGVFTRDNLKAALTQAFPTTENSEEPAESDESDTEADGASADLTHESDHRTVSTKKVTPPTRSTRTRRINLPKQVTSQPVENDIRSRLRPRRPRV